MSNTVGLGLALAAAFSRPRKRSRITAPACSSPRRKVTVAGTVTDFQFVNPHVLVYMTSKVTTAKTFSGAASSRARTGSRATPAQ